MGATIEVTRPFKMNQDPDAYYVRIECDRHPPRTVKVLTRREIDSRGWITEQILTARQVSVLRQHERLHKTERARWRKSRKSAL